MIIKIDVDGVIRDLVGSMCDMYNEVVEDISDSVKPDDITDYDVDKSFPLISKSYGMKPSRYFFNERAEDTFRNYAFPLGFDSGSNMPSDAIRMLRDAGHKIVICTWQFTNSNKKTALDFLDEWCIPYDDICFTRDKWLIGSDIIIDDNPEFLMDKREKSKIRMLIDQPYNKECTIKRYANIMEAVLEIVPTSF